MEGWQASGAGRAGGGHCRKPRRPCPAAAHECAYARKHGRTASTFTLSQIIRDHMHHDHDNATASAHCPECGGRGSKSGQRGRGRPGGLAQGKPKGKRWTGQDSKRVQRTGKRVNALTRPDAARPASPGGGGAAAGQQRCSSGAAVVQRVVAAALHNAALHHCRRAGPQGLPRPGWRQKAML